MELISTDGAKPSLDFQTWLKTFKGRRPVDSRDPLKYDERIVLGINKNGIKSIFEEVMLRCAAQYNAISSNPARARHNIGKTIEKDVLEVIQIPSELPITLVVTKSFTTYNHNHRDRGTYPLHHPGIQEEHFALTIYRGHFTNDDDIAINLGSHEEVGEFRIAKRGDAQWELEHRLISEPYRDQDLGSCLAQGIYNFVQTQAELCNAPQELVINTGQPKVLFFFLRKDFKARTKDDGKRIKKIQSGDASLVLDFARIKDIDINNNPTGRSIIDAEKDMYIYESTVDERTERSAYRVEIRREFKPRQKNADSILDDVQKQASDVL